MAYPDQILSSIVASGATGWLKGAGDATFGEVHAELQQQISGAAGFLVTKLIVNGILHSECNAALKEEGVEFGPGALASQWSGLLLLRTGRYKISQKHKWGEVTQADREAVNALVPIVAPQIATFLRTVAVAYWKARKEADKQLCLADATMEALIDRIIPLLVVEGLECEVRRRRTASLMWARFLFPYAPKVSCISRTRCALLLYT